MSSAKRTCGNCKYFTKMNSLNRSIWVLGSGRVGLCDPLDVVTSPDSNASKCPSYSPLKYKRKKFNFKEKLGEV
jgi:hypothetical protein